MADTAPQSYQRLPGTGYRQMVPTWALVLLFLVIGIFVLLLRGRRVQLWLGEDHLLMVDWDGYREYYKRFRFEDIQSVIIERTAAGNIASAILGVIVLIFIGLGLVVNDPVGLGIFLVLAAIFGLILLSNALQGPTCKCALRTAVQTEPLHSLNRVRNARKVLDRLRPLITAAQGELATEEIPQRLQEAALAEPAATLSAISLTPRSPTPVMPAPPRPYQSKVHFILFCLLLADVPFTLAHLLHESTATTTANIIWLVAAIGWAVAALVKQGGTNLPRLLKNIPWVFLIASVVQFVAGLAYVIYAGIHDPDRNLESATSMQDPAMLALTAVSTLLNATLGVIGLLQLRQFRVGQPAVPPPPASDTPSPV